MCNSLISPDFAPNESWDDAWLSLKLLFQPWRWQQGQEIKKVKNQIIKLLNLQSSTSKVILFLSGRSALYFLLKSLNFPQKSSVIVQGFTCEAVILPILANDLKPVYVDIEDKTFSVNPVDLEKKITPKTKVVILQYTFGLTPINRERIISIINKNNLLLIEDMAHGFYRNIFNKKNNATMKQWNNRIFLLSFGRSKALSSVFGGAIITNNEELATNLNRRLAKLKNPSIGFIFKCLLYKPIAVLIKSTYNCYSGKIIHLISKKLNLIPPEISDIEKRGEYNPLLDKAYPNALAILLFHQLTKFKQIEKQRTRICDLYINRFQNVTSFWPPLKAPLLRFPLLVNNRDQIIKKAKKNNIILGKWYDQVVAPKSLDLKKMGYNKGSCPVAEKICERIINLPTNINQKQAEAVIKFFENYNFQ